MPRRREAVLVGKPSREFFRPAVKDLGIAPDTQAICAAEESVSRERHERRAIRQKAELGIEHAIGKFVSEIGDLQEPESVFDFSPTLQVVRGPIS